MRVLPLVGLTLSLAAVSASSAQAADFGCSASAGRITVLGQTVEPVSANAGAATCQPVTNTLTGPAAALPLPLSAGALVAATEVYPQQQSVLASGGIADISVKALPDLPIQLPAVPDAVKQAVADALKTVDLTAVKNAIPVLPTNLVTNLATNLPTNQVLDPLNALLATSGLVAASNAANLATNTANAAINAANLATNTANAALNQLRDTIPSTVPIDTSFLTNLLSGGKLPNLELLHVRGAMAYATGSCQTGSPVVNGSSAVAGLTVLGQDLPVDQAIDKVKTLIQATTIDPTNLTLTASSLGLNQQQAALINSVVGSSTALTTALDTINNAVKGALGATGISLPETLAEVKVTPGKQVRSGSGITQQALNVVVTIAGQKIVDAVIGEAKASASGACAAAAPTAPAVDPDTTTGATLECSKRDLVLVDVLERAGRVKLTGVANPKFAGKTVSIVFGATGRTVAHARVARDGSFHTTAAMPPANLRASNRARYTAKLGREKSINLKLRRRMVIDSMTSRNGYVTIKGRVIQPLARPGRAITLMRRVSCTRDKVETRFRPASNGRFSVRVRAPRGVGTAVYRMTTKVLNSSSGTALFETFTLPRAVDLHR